MTTLDPAALAVIGGYHADPFAYLGLHDDKGKCIVRAFLPGARSVVVVDDAGRESELQQLHESGLFVGAPPSSSRQYRLRARFGDRDVDLEDAYRFPPILGDLDLYLLGEGTHMRAYDKLGAHPLTMEGVEGVGFIVLAPNARRVSVVGDFNFWDGRRHPMRVRGKGFWELFVPGATANDKYKFEIFGAGDVLLPLKSDPYAFAAELRPSTGSIMFDETKLAPATRAPANVNDLRLVASSS
jgi:1,4-alpha-glucan branching enzyme